MSAEGNGFSLRDKRIVLIACCIAGFVSPLITTMINPAIPAISDEFGISAHSQGWLIMSYFLSSVAFLIPMSRLSDLYGKKRILMIGIVVVLVSSLMSALADSFAMLLMWRIVMGMGTACIASTSISMIVEVYPKAHRGLPLAINTMCIYIGASIGPGLGGMLTEIFEWRTIFIALIPFSVAGLIATFYFKTDFKTSEGEPFDIRGSLLYALGIIVLMYGIITLPNALSGLFIAGGAVLLIAFFNFESRAEHPVLMVRLFSGKVFRRSNLAALLNYGSSFAVLYTVNLYLQYIVGLGPATAGMIILMQPVIQAAITPFSGKMSDRIDPRILTTAGMMLMCISTVMMMMLTSNVSMMKIYLILAFTGAGYALFSAPNTNLIMGNVCPKNYSESSGVISAMRQVGMMSSMAIVMCMISLNMGTTAAIEPDTFDAFINSIRYSFAVCFILAVIGCFMTWFSREDPCEDETRI
ncbi:MAG: MFS transporter [Methanomassiliicoccaceae archaeon]|nr:MFS transporter [Methanomassiliicoccaceae archaeon]